MDVVRKLCVYIPSELSCHAENNYYLMRWEVPGELGNASVLPLKKGNSEPGHFTQVSAQH